MGVKRGQYAWVGQAGGAQHRCFVWGELHPVPRVPQLIAAVPPQHVLYADQRLPYAIFSYRCALRFQDRSLAEHSALQPVS